MNINRLNYENYFLLYVDGELSAAEMQAVESFAAENKDLADELDTLLLTKLPTEDTYHFDNKSTLLRTTAVEINSINYEEKFLLFVDQELTEKEAAGTLDFVLKHPSYKAEFESIQQAKLPLETIAYPYKDALFRKEDRKPVILMQWWKLAVAAALIGIMALVGIWGSFNNPSTTIAKTKIITKPDPSINQKNDPDQPPQNQQKEQPIYVQQESGIKHKDEKKLSKNLDQIQPVASEIITAKTENTRQNIAQETIALNTNSNATIINNHTIGIESNAHVDQITAINTANRETAASNFTQPAVYKELDTDDERKSLYVGSIEINKDKFRGFLRKASSLFKGRNKTEEEKTELSNSHSLE